MTESKQDKVATEATPAVPTRGERWKKYGTNVGAMILATIMIVTIVNFMAYRHAGRVDFTHNRRYTLSEQTRKVLNDLDVAVSITTLYRANSTFAEQLAEVDNLLSEYKLRGKNVTITHIDPTIHLSQFEKFVADVKSRFPKEVAEREELLTKARDAVKKLEEFLASVKTPLNDLSGMAVGTAPAIERLIEQIRFASQASAIEIDQLNKDIENMLAEPFPDHGAIIRSCRSLLEPWTGGGQSAGDLKTASGTFNALSNVETLPEELRDRCLVLRNLFEEASKSLTESAKPLGTMQPSDLDRIARLLFSENCVAVRTDDPKDAANQSQRGIEILTLNELFPTIVLPEDSQGVQKPQTTYKGEEAVTAAILKLTLKHKTRVVFVNPGSQPLVMGRMADLTYQNVASELAAMNFQVEEWQPGGMQIPGRPPMQPQPKPVAGEGETLILIGLPIPPSDPLRPMQANGAAGAIKALAEHIRAGKPALIMTAPTNALELAGGPNEMVDALAKMYGVNVQSKSVILQPYPGREKGATNQLPVNITDAGHAVARAVAGLPGAASLAQPIELQKVEGVKSYPLVQSPAESWAEADLPDTSRETLARQERNAEDAAGPFVFAALAEKDQSRVAIIADNYWAADFIVDYGPRLTGNPMDPPLYRMFPANSALFTNAVYWLAGLDQLVAPGARAKDTRRITGLEGSHRTFWQWTLIAGLPVLCLGAGLGVWTVRRR